MEGCKRLSEGSSDTQLPVHEKDASLECQPAGPGTCPWNFDFNELPIDKYLDSNLSDRPPSGDNSFLGTWPSGKGLAEYLEQHGSTMFELGTLPEMKVLEIGAGCGWLGITLARNVPSAVVVLSDRASSGAVDWTKMNVEFALASRGNRPCGQVSVMPFDWASETDLDAVVHRGPWQLVLGSDLVFTAQGVNLLARVFQQLLLRKAASRIVYAHATGRVPELDMQWQAATAERGIQRLVLFEQAISDAEDNSPGTDRKISIFEYRLPDAD